MENRRENEGILKIRIVGLFVIQTFVSKSRASSRIFAVSREKIEGTGKFKY